MSVIKKSPNIAILFGILAIATAIILIIDAPKIIKYIFAVFWFIIGLLGFYASMKSKL